MQDGQNGKFKDPPEVKVLVNEDGDGQTRCPSCGLTVSANSLVCPNDGTRLTATLGGDARLSDKYEFLGKLAEGGMGAVYKVRHKMLDKQFAIKILHANMSSQIGVKRFKREAQTTMELRHPGIVGVHDFGVSDQGQPFIVMELVSGRTLSQLIASDTVLPLPDVIDMFKQLAEAIAYAHSKGVIHRDIKPSNIILEETSDGRLHARLLDFGIARIPQTEGNTLTTTGEVFGSPGYMSPEQCAGQTPDERSDVYSLACTLYETLTKQPLFTGANSLELVYKHSNEKPLTLTEACENEVKFPQGLEDLLAIALAKDKEDRFAGMNEFADALSRAESDKRIARTRSRGGGGGGGSGGGAGAGRARGTTGTKRGGKLIWITVAGLLIIFAVLVACLSFTKAPPPSPTYQVGQKLEVKWENAWYPSEVVSVEGDKVKIHYLSYDPKFDEWVRPQRLHTIGNPAGGARKIIYENIKRGGDFEVEWHGHWYRCDVMDLNDGTRQAFIHFSGYDHKDDEWVTPEQLRTPTTPDQPEVGKD